MLNRLRKRFRDRTRDNLTTHLTSLGIPASIAERNRPEERVSRLWIFRRSLGLIDISVGPIKSINVLKRDRSKDAPPRWWFAFLVPAEIPISRDHTFKIKTVRRKTFPLFGKVIDVYWKGNDRGTGLVDVLSQDETVDKLVSTHGDLSVRSYKKRAFNGWVIQYSTGRPTNFELDIGEWQTLSAIANRLLYISS